MTPETTEAEPVKSEPDVSTASTARPATAEYMEEDTASAPVETIAAEPGTAEDTEEDCTERAVRVPVNKPTCHVILGEENLPVRPPCPSQTGLEPGVPSSGPR